MKKSWFTVVEIITILLIGALIVVVSVVSLGIRVGGWGEKVEGKEVESLSFDGRS